MGQRCRLLGEPNPSCPGAGRRVKSHKCTVAAEPVAGGRETHQTKTVAEAPAKDPVVAIHGKSPPQRRRQRDSHRSLGRTSAARNPVALGVDPAAGGAPYIGYPRSHRAERPCRSSHKGRTGRGPSFLDGLQNPATSLQRVGLLPPIAQIRRHLCDTPTTLAEHEADTGRLRCARCDCRACPLGRLSESAWMAKLAAKPPR